MRTYGEPVEVRVVAPLAGLGIDAGPAAAADADVLRLEREGSPAQFLWRGRLYVVREVLAHWVELGTWWTGSSRATAPAPPASVPPASEAQALAAQDLPERRSVARDVGAVEREVWRVEARAGRSSSIGVYDLVHDIPPVGGAGSRGRSRWRLARALD